MTGGASLWWTSKMTALLEAKQIYAKLGLDFERDLGFYLTNGFVISMPDRFIMAKPIVKEHGDDPWNEANPNAWYLHFAVGKNCLRWFFDQAPIKLPFLAWRRLKGSKQSIRIYSTDSFQRFMISNKA